MQLTYASYICILHFHLLPLPLCARLDIQDDQDRAKIALMGYKVQVLSITKALSCAFVVPRKVHAVHPSHNHV